MTDNAQRPSVIAYAPQPLPEQFCNLERLVDSLVARDLDGIVVTSPYNTFYLSGFKGIAHKADEPRPYAVILSRHKPDHPVLVVADYYVSSLLDQPTWIKDIRSFRAVMLPLDLPPGECDLDRFLPQYGLTIDWVKTARDHFADNIGAACRQVLTELGLASGRVAFDDLRFGNLLAMDGVTIADGYDPMMYARSVKTSAEIELLRRSTRLNEQAIRTTIDKWQRGMTWREFNHAYHRTVIDLGGFVRDPGAMVWGHPCGGDRAVILRTALEDFVVEPGLHVMFDCHGTLDLYCWDGGKTWVVDGEASGDTRRHANATAEAAAAVLGAMRPGTRISELQRTGREVYSKVGVPDADAVLIFFHGLGLSHMDLEQHTSQGVANIDWQLEDNMVVPLHILYPGDEHQRLWLEEVVRVTPDGGEALFSWGLDPLIAA